MARLFDDANQEYLEVDVPIVTAPPFTISAWASTDVVQNQTVLFIGDKDLGINGDWWRLRFISPQQDIEFDALHAGTRRRARTTVQFSTNTYHHVCGIEAATDDRRVFIDGGGKGTDTNNNVVSNVDRSSIGRSGDSSPSDYMSGLISQVAVWNIALTDEEVASLAAGVSPLALHRDNLIYYNPLGTSGPGLDVVGKNNMTDFGTSVGGEPPIPNTKKIAA